MLHLLSKYIIPGVDTDLVWVEGVNSIVIKSRFLGLHLRFLSGRIDQSVSRGHEKPLGLREADACKFDDRREIRISVFSEVRKGLLDNN